MLQDAKKQDPTRLYANASNAHYGNEGCDEESDFYASQSFYNYRIRGTLAGNPETTEEAAKVDAYEKANGKLQKVNTLRVTSTISIQMRRQTLMKPAKD